MQLVPQLPGKGLVSCQFLLQPSQIFILVLGLSPQGFQAGHCFRRQRSGRFGRKFRLMDLPLQFFFLQRQRALFGGQPVFLLPLGFQLPLVFLQFPAGFCCFGFTSFLFGAQLGQIFFQFPGGKHTAFQFLFQLGDGIVIMLDVVFFDCRLYLRIGDCLLILPDAVAFMLNIQVCVLCFLLNFLQRLFTLGAALIILGITKTALLV